MSDKSRDNKVAFLLLDDQWWFHRRSWTEVESGRVMLAGPYGTKERAVEQAHHPEWACHWRKHDEAVLANAEYQSFDDPDNIVYLDNEATRKEQRRMELKGLGVDDTSPVTPEVNYE